MSSGKPPLLTRKQDLYLKDVPGKGRGVFCRRNIRRGETLEVTPAVLLNEKSTVTADKTLLRQYTFVVGGLPAGLRKALGIRKPSQASAVIMGLMTFCNHGDRPNAEIVWEIHGGTVYYSLEATRDIPKNTEICTTYGDKWFEERDAQKS